MKVIASAFGACMLSIISAASAQISGGIVVNVEDQTQRRCIDVSRESVSMKVVALQAKRTEGFWKESKSLGAKFDVVIANDKGQPFTFPRGAQLSAKEYVGDIGILPAQFSVMSKYPLRSANAPYTSVGLKLYLIDIVDKSDTAKILQTFIKFTKGLPLPINPYTTGVQLFGTFADQVIDQSVANSEDKLPAAELSFDLASNAEEVKSCPQTALRTGTLAVIFSYAGTGDGVLDINRANEFCYTYNEIVGRVEMRARKADKTCDPKGDAKFVRNPLVALLVNTYSIDPARVDPAAVVPLRASFDVWSIERNSAKEWSSASNNTFNNVLQSNVAAVTANRSTLASRPGTAGPLALPGPVATSAFADVAAENVRITGQRLQSAAGYQELNGALRAYKIGDAARVVELETAVALSRCAVVGIGPKDCD